MLEFYNNRQPTMPMALRGADGQRIVLHICVPTVDLADKIREILPALKEVADGLTESTGPVYAVAAAVISRNLQGHTVTVDDLQTVHALSLDDLYKFYEEYVAFLRGVERAKN